MTRSDRTPVAQVDTVDVTEQTDLDLVDVGGLEPTGGPYKPTTDDPEVEHLVKPMGGPYKPTGDPETNGGPYKPTTDEPVAVAPAQ